MNTNYDTSGAGQGAITQPSKVYRGEEQSPRRKRRRRGRGLFIFLLLIGAYLLFPSRHTVLILGIDRAFENTAIGRSDTNLLVGVRPLPGSVSVLSIPRDLWVTIPGVGENRINTAHYFGEGELAGEGPYRAMETVEQNFGVEVNRYIRIQLEKFPEVVNAMGGIDLELESAMAGYPAGTHHLDGEQALAFVRDRAGTDDFFRMAQAQVFLRSYIKAVLNPGLWPRLPAILGSTAQAVDTNIPLWQLPRVSVAVVRAYLFDQISFVIIQREDITPWVTNEGAQVLLPDWPKIHAKIKEDF